MPLKYVRNVRFIDTQNNFRLPHTQLLTQMTTIEAGSQSLEDEQFSNSQVTVILLRHSLHDEGIINDPGRALIAKAVDKIDRHFLGKGPIHFQLSYSPTASEGGQRRAENTGLILQEGLTTLPNSRFIPAGVVMRNSLQGNLDPSFETTLKPIPRSPAQITTDIDRLTTSFLLFETRRPDLVKPSNWYTFICVTHGEILIPWLKSHGASFDPSEEMPRADPIFVTLNTGKLKIDYPAKIR